MNFKKKSIENLINLSKKIRRDILFYSYFNHTGHISSCLSVADILSVLYGSILYIDAKNPTDVNRDRFILSKGHAALALYACLSSRGFFSKESLNNFCKNGSKFGTHPEYGISGIEFSTGSLGHGLSVGVGMALAAKLDKKKYKVYILMSDAELNEGSIWEAAQFAAHHKLDNLTLIIDENGLQAFGKTKNVLDLQDISVKFKDFGWASINTNGHDHEKLFEILEKMPLIKEKPTVLVAKTTAGKGVSFMEGKIEWHYNNLDENLYNLAMKEN